MKQQKYIVEMTEQEYNKCNQMLNEFGYIERSPEVKKLYDKKRKIEDEIYTISKKYTVQKSSTLNLSHLVHLSIEDLVKPHYNDDVYINELINDIEKLTLLYTQIDDIYEEIKELVDKS